MTDLLTNFIERQFPTVRTPDEQAAYEARQAELTAEKIRDDSMAMLQDEGILPWGRTDHDCPVCLREMVEGVCEFEHKGI